MSRPYHLTIAEAGAKLRDGALSSVALTEAYLDRIATIDRELNCFITLVAEEAREAAEEADREIAAGCWKGPLHGVPIGLKDIYETAGVRTTCHSRLLEENVPAEDAETVARLKAAGAIIIGKLATHEFAFGGPSFDLPWPPARNPWNPDHVPAGSSSGSGAAVSAGLCAGAMGSDTGGSIRSPAGVCGIAGLKPTYGLLSRRGIYPLSWTQDHAGPMARTVEDCALMMQALAGYDPLDPGSVETAAPDFVGALGRSVRGLRIGLIRAWHEGVADTEVCDAIEQAAGLLRQEGAEVRDVTLPDVADFHACGRIIILSEAWTIHRDTVTATPEKYGEFFRNRVRLGAFLNAGHYIEAQRMRRRLTEETMAVMKDCDILLAANQYGPAERFEDSQRPFPFFSKPYLTMPFNITGQPALTVPAGFGVNGLPFGLQFAGRPFEDDVVLQVGHAYEKARSHLDFRPPL